MLINQEYTYISSSITSVFFFLQLIIAYFIFISVIQSEIPAGQQKYFQTANQYCTVSC